MSEFLKNIMQGKGFEPPENCVQELNRNFEDARNVEWSEKQDTYEAIFYKDNLEYIALFDKEGKLLEYKMFLSIDLLPEAIKNSLESQWEIMNVVLINKGNEIEYEAIVRDRQLDRYLIQLSNLGKALFEKKL